MKGVSMQALCEDAYKITQITPIPFGHDNNILYFNELA
jgi:hypothetical protein